MNATHAAPPQRILLIDGDQAVHQEFAKIFAAPAHSMRAHPAESSLVGSHVEAPAGLHFHLDSAFEGNDGVTRVRAARAEDFPYTMAFVDVRLPQGWDGLAMIRHLLLADEDLQVVLCTDSADYAWDEMIQKVDFNDRLVILKKPFDRLEALQLAHALSAKWQLARQLQSQVDSLGLLVTERTAALHKTETHFRLIAEHVADMIAVIDRDCVAQYRSPSYEKVLGYSPAEIEGSAPAELVHPEDRAEVMQSVQTIVDSGMGRALEFRMSHRDGSWRLLEATLNPVRDAAGVSPHLVMVARDITGRRKAEEESRSLEVQLRHSQKMESIGQLAAGIAHEINTPTQYLGDNSRFLQDAFQDLLKLIVMQGQLITAAKTHSEPADLLAVADVCSSTIDLPYLLVEVPKAIEQSLAGLSNISRIVGALKEFSHPGTREKTATDLNRAIESTITVTTNEWKYVAKMETEFDADLPLVPCFAGEFNQVILNMIVNAAHAIGDVVGDGHAGKGLITIGTRLAGPWVEVYVRDTGCGIPEPLREKIFDPFFTTKGVGRGTGQGLAIAHAVIVEKHQGMIQVQSEVGRGTVFILRLPLGEACEERSAA